MRAHILAIAVITGVVIASLAAGRALTAHFLGTAPASAASEPDAAPVPHK